MKLYTKDETFKEGVKNKGWGDRRGKNKYGKS